MTDEDMKLDDLMSGDGPAVSENQEHEASEQQAEARPRDEHGRFAAKEADKADEAGTRQEAENPQQGTQPEDVEDHARKGGDMIPRGRLDAEIGKRRDLEAQVAEMRGQLQAIMTQQRQPQQPTAKEEQKAPEIWDDPNAFLQHALSPVQQQMQQQTERFSRMMAVQTHGEEKVGAAYQALGQALQSDPSARADYQRIMQSEHPYDALVKWHSQQQTRQMVGDDPMKWFESEFEKRLSDPQQQSKILERIRGAASANTSRSQPNTQLPPSLNRLPGGGNRADDGDMSDEALFSQALR